MSLVKSFWNTLAKHASAPALQDDKQVLTYAELLDEVQKRSLKLQQIDARRVALAMDNGIDWILWDLAVLQARLVCVPIPGFFSLTQQQHVLDNAGVDLVITSQDVPYLRDFRHLEGAFYQRSPASIPALPVGTCKITYTSGTTGTPKGVCLDDISQLTVAQSLWQASQSSHPEHHLCVLPLATLLENVAGVYAPLLGGACVHVRTLSQVGLLGASGFNIQKFLETLHQTQPNSLILLPQLLLALVSAAEQGYPLPSSLRFIAVGGGRVASQLLERAKALQLPVFEGYGLSECASVVCLNTPEANQIGTVGKPLPHVQISLAADHEVLVRGNHFLGYLGDSSPNAQEEWLATGDLGHFEGEFLVLHGRKKNQFITAYGRNVNPEWIEAELVQQAAIAQAWVYGEALAENFAVLVPRTPHCTDQELQKTVEQVNTTLPDYAQVHRWIRAEHPFTVDNGLATSNGRLRRATLVEYYQATIDSSHGALPVSSTSL